ncbi:MAG: ATP-binding cassette domain-containing protein, partial [Hyphomicrobiales bacterium]|nr:ATP-binding cassette domain-containing protein [Hyphomicrobiales bacterium]
MKQGSLLNDLVKAGGRQLTSAAVLSMFINLLALTLPLYMLQVFTHVLVSESAPTLVLITIIALIALAIWGVLSEVRARILRLLGDKIDILLGERVQRAMIAHATTSNEMRTAGGLKDLATLRTSIGSNQTAAIFDAPWAPLFLLVVYLLSPTLGIIAACGAGLLIILAWINDRWTRAPQAAAGQSAEKEHTFSLSSVRNAEVVEGMGMRSTVVGRWQQQHLKSLGLQAKGLSRGGVVSNASRSLRFMLQVVIMGAGAFLVIRHEIGVGAMMASVYLLSRALAPIDMAIGMWRQMVAAQASYGRLSLLLQVEETRPDGLKLPRPEGRLTVQNVVFGRPGLPPVLKGVSFAAAPGDTVGIVGPSAAGKSTLAKLLVGVWRPTSGVVRLDGADVTNWDPDDLGSHLGYLPQEVELFAGTVSDNIS